MKLLTRHYPFPFVYTPWCWERLRAGGEGSDRGWDGWMASLTQRTWVWASSGRWWRAGKPGVLQSMGSQRVVHSWAMEQQQPYSQLADDSHRKLLWFFPNSVSIANLGCSWQKNTVLSWMLVGVFVYWIREKWTAKTYVETSLICQWHKGLPCWIR